ncbi:MAG TPA: ABC transporter permease subunit [Ktedonobacteraceae bacterium]|nr:ABC transporter permease subunit [Ktedonobacteraceae bacterium]
MTKIIVILQKEWSEIIQQRALMLTIILLPLLFTLIPIAAITTTSQIDLSSTNTSTVAIAKVMPSLAGMNSKEVGQALIGMQMSILYILLPVVITSVIASYSIVGEKTSRTLEPLLATPVHTSELLLGKSLAALIPAVVVTWIAGGLFIAFVALFAVSNHVFSAIVSPGWLIIFLLWTPVLGLIGIEMMVAISSRVNDPRTAQQFSVFLVLPVIGLIFGQISGLLVLGPIFALSAFVVLVLVAILAVWIVTRLFQREVILTRWK